MSTDRQLFRCFIYCKCPTKKLLRHCHEISEYCAVTENLLPTTKYQLKPTLHFCFMSLVQANNAVRRNKC